jgi:hypothetical protein
MVCMFLYNWSTILLGFLFVVLYIVDSSIYID